MANMLARLMDTRQDTVPAATNTIQLRKLYQSVLENPGPDDIDERGEVIRFPEWVKRHHAGTGMIVAQ